MKIRVKKIYGDITVYGNLAATQILTIKREGILLACSVNREVGLTLDGMGGDKIEVEE